MIARLPEIARGNTDFSSYDTGFVRLNLDEYGEVFILRIEEIGSSWDDVSYKYVNCLLEEED